MSLKMRLAFWYGCLTGAVVVLMCLILYAVHTRAHYDDLDYLLQGDATHIAGEYTTGVLLPPEVVSGTTEAVTPITISISAPDVVIRAYNRAGKVIAASPNAIDTPAVDVTGLRTGSSVQSYDVVAALAPSFVQIDSGRGSFGLRDGADGSRWRVYLLTTSGSRPTLNIVATTSLSRIDIAVERFRWLVVLLGTIGTLFAFVAGWVLGGLAVRPVAQLTAVAGAIADSHELGRRVPVAAIRSARQQQDELVRLSLVFNQMLGSLEQANRSQQRFMADASHELRAPLTALQANLELLESQPNMPISEQHEALNEAGREVRRLSRLVADLLALARADAGLSLNKERVELDRVLLETLVEARHVTEGKQIEVAQLEPTMVYGNPDRLKQLLIILTDNALKYTPLGGQVTLSLRQVARRAEIEVRDTGVGIPAADLPHVFERFYRADPARSRDPGGTGLGLSIARWIVEQHGGEISLSSSPGQGTIATVRLPMRIPQ